MKQCISLPSKQLVQDLLASLATLFSAMANAELPNRLRPYLCSGSLIPANKKDGGIRPIVLGDVMASLCSKILLNQLSDDLLPLVPQMTIADRGGNFQDCQPWQSNIVKVDIRNAFNSINRG